jgi:serine/threonine protein kinase
MFGRDFCVDDLADLNKKRVTVHVNGDFENGKTLFMQAHWDMDEFLNAASNRLVVAATRVFNADGKELEDVMLAEEDDILFVSAGADFEAPGPTSPARGGPGIRFYEDDDASHLPATIGGYHVGGFLGRGGFGEVRIGYQQMSGEAVALKFLPKSSIESMDSAERTTTEIQCLTALKHPNIIRLLQQLESLNYVILVFEYMKGGDLLQYLCGLPDKCLPEDEARSVFHQVLLGVGHAHNHHICHRDLKLDNILVSESGLASVKVADFGLSEFYRPGSSKRSNCGSLSYLAPEVFLGTSNAGPPLDAWSLGVILFAMLFGRLPFEGPDLVGANRPRESIIRNRISKCQYSMDESMAPDAKDLVRRMLKLDPSERASIPEVFSHFWLRSSTQLVFSAAERSSLPSAIDAGALRGERIAAKEDEGLAEAEFEFGGC